MQFTVATAAAVLAAVPSIAGAALEPRAASVRFWTLQPLANDADFQPLKNSVIGACNGKFSIGGTTCHQSAQLTCVTEGGAATACSLVATNGNQPVYIDADGALRFVAPNAQVPAGNTASIWSSGASDIAYVKNSARGGSTTFAGEFVACAASGNNGRQLYALTDGFKGCSDAHIFKMGRGSYDISGSYDSY
ncbi:MAG: hypothetical protein M1833_004964 [Piccolia ochrophora]|nr:MAG: hypothetical protein M1833_004964 [Piccolia ochrophora]